MQKLSLRVFTLLVFASIACGGGAREVSTPISIRTLTIEASRVPQRVGTTQQLRAIVTFSDHRTRDVTECATWTTDENHVVAINSSDGRETALKAGDATVFATFKAFGKSANASISLQVIAAVLPPTTIESAILQRELFMDSQYGRNRALTQGSMQAAKTRHSKNKQNGARRLNTAAERLGGLRRCAATQETSSEEKRTVKPDGR